MHEKLLRERMGTPEGHKGLQAACAGKMKKSQMSYGSSSGGGLVFPINKPHSNARLQFWALPATTAQ